MNVLERLQQKFGDKITGANLDAIDKWIEVAPDAIAEVCQFLRDEPDLRFDMLSCISGVDYFEPDPKKAKKADWEPHTEVVYHLFSITNKQPRELRGRDSSGVTLKVILPRWKDGVEGELPEVPSVAGVFSTADWHEREVYDLNGVHFVGHPDL